jgi:hypothetical protein
MARDSKMDGYDKMSGYSKADGKQSIRKGSDCGAHEAFQKADSPKSVKDAAKGQTPYKHR